MFERAYYVYILTNKRNNVLYIGVTNDLDRRIYEHKNKINKSFSEKYNLNKLVYYEEYRYVEDAIYREKQLKNWRREWKKDLIKKLNPKWEDLSTGWGFSPFCHPELDSGSHPLNEMPDQVRHDKRGEGNTSKKIQLGKFGEQIAAKYLISKGYKILTTNYHTREGEIDLICNKDGIVIFIEVKTRTNRLFGWPEEAVTEQKLEKMATAAEKYIEKNRINSEWQIDIISIIANRTTKTAKINHLKNIDSYPFNG